ncbi:Glutamine amidotransferase [Kalmanozyma brasiliensis GHG001]|uniref:Glutamine amidotransferase n=1 Tax=Kalmanozyma brasiliensis (strain GHG001) TaxID=1365824 RepID=V5EKL7_KALBG|nr:Glutamine amidotransferase [Kalmanozyma brasiliensis GHG001]EST05465.1 Glutamine amidotransferase [Kalmanozyma brasiliensis GHG001]
MAQQQKKKVVSIALLVADTPPPPVVAVRGDYTQIYPRFLQESLNTIKRHSWQPQVELHVRCYDVVKKMEYPDEGQLGDGLWDAVMITGSASSAYLDLEWTRKLAAFLRATAENHPLVRLIGICYGHQILARAFDGQVVSNPKGWELGTFSCTLTPHGKELLGYDENETQMAIQQVHKDHVPELPPDFAGESFENLASTEISPIQSLILRYPTEAPPLASTAQASAYMAFDIEDSETASSGPNPLRSMHLLSFQGHPEFDREIVENIIEVRTEMGIVTGELREKSLVNAKKPHDGLKLGRAILAMLGVEEARTDTGDSMVHLQ